MNHDPVLFSGSASPGSLRIDNLICWACCFHTDSEDDMWQHQSDSHGYQGPQIRGFT